MWKLYTTAKTTATRPSDLVCINDRWTALQFDNAVTTVGNVLESARDEMQKTGTTDNPKWEPKYTMSQLLDDKFRLPAPPTPADRDKEMLAGLQAMAGVISVNPMMTNRTK